jgi:DNA-binding FadR family transcriptional regulator
MVAAVHDAVPSSPARVLVGLGGCVLVLRGAGEEAVQALRVRRVLEPMLAQAAAGRGTPADADELDALVTRMHAARSDPAAFLRCNWALHRRVAALAGNPVLAGVHATLLDIAEAQLEDVVAEPGFDGRADWSVAVHRELVRAIAAGDSARVAGASERHERLTAPAVVH